MQNDKLLNYFHLHFIVFIWGFTAVLGDLITIEAVPLVWHRMLLGSLFVLIYIIYNKGVLKVSLRSLIKFAFVGLLIALHWLAFFSAVKVSNVSITLAMMSTGAFFASFLEPIFFKRKIIGYEVIFGLIVIMGLYIIFKVESAYLSGILLALLASFLGTLFSIFNGMMVKSHNATVISFYELLFGLVFITLYILFTDGYDNTFFILSGSDWTYLIILASICTAYAFIASVHVMKWISPYTVMLTTNMEPVYGILLALLILGEKEYMSPAFYLGAIIILITVVINGIIKTRKKD
ncbi:DMT family transporter [Flavobacteriaceae bacterium]|jgi:drug/metabolite transporter (DMT)-like permease|nr:DMT family transporter [Polaribacter sp.]MDB9913018.1 DMT family transporter [Flavobacteriaceae bacterium]MDB9993415.1 DMT family transporter [Flavobacteriaceae bacterium]|tara:strand:+ start:147 stop:1025 length:879 start_codon:yes stop_codon:yes gene_type:complete